MGVAWTVISSVEQLKPFLVGAQVDAIDQAALGDSQTDRFTDVAKAVVDRVRNKVASNTGNLLSATAMSVPPECVSLTCWLIIESMQAGIPGLALTADQVRLIGKAEKDLDDVVSGDLKVSEPVDPLEPTPVQGGGAIRVVSNATRLATREKMSGL